MNIQVVYQNAKGRGYVRSVYSEFHLREMLEQLRTEAKVQLVKDGKTEIIGGVERTDAADDRRIKWQWWFDAGAVKKVFESEDEK